MRMSCEATRSRTVSGGIRRRSSARAARSLSTGTSSEARRSRSSRVAFTAPSYDIAGTMRTRYYGAPATLESTRIKEVVDGADGGTDRLRIPADGRDAGWARRRTDATRRPAHHRVRRVDRLIVPRSGPDGWPRNAV